MLRTIASGLAPGKTSNRYEVTNEAEVEEDCKVKVAIRCRPMNQLELNRNEKTVAKASHRNSQITMYKSRKDLPP
jgi:hypothetical protein